MCEYHTHVILIYMRNYNFCMGIFLVILSIYKYLEILGDTAYNCTHNEDGDLFNNK